MAAVGRLEGKSTTVSNWRDSIAASLASETPAKAVFDLLVELGTEHPDGPLKAAKFYLTDGPPFRLTRPKT